MSSNLPAADPTLAAALDEYTEAAAALDAFRDVNREILLDLEILQHGVAVEEAKLKELAREQGPVANDAYTVNVSYPKRRWYDCDLILERTPYLKEIPGVIVTTTTVDRAKIESLVKGGFVPAAVAGEALREEPMTPAVTIKRRGGAAAG
ncbi:MAG: hypothetical protein WC718_14900 [Phycisphaerales bacterium]|jgi:hypothetical protein